MIKRTHPQSLGATKKSIEEYRAKIAELEKVITEQKYLDATLCKKCHGSGIYYTGDYGANLHICKHEWADGVVSVNLKCPRCNSEPMVLIDSVYHCGSCFYSTSNPLTMDKVKELDMTIIEMILFFRPTWSAEACASFSRINALASIQAQQTLVNYLNQLFLPK